MARHKYNGVRDRALGFKKRTGVDLDPPIGATAEQKAEWVRARAARRARLAKKEEEEEKRKRERMEALWAEEYVEKEVPRRACDACKRRHIKCDKADFCDQCRRRKAYVCTYAAE